MGEESIFKNELSTLLNLIQVYQNLSLGHNPPLSL